MPDFFIFTGYAVMFLLCIFFWLVIGWCIIMAVVFLTEELSEYLRDKRNQRDLLKRYAKKMAKKGLL